MPMPSSAVPAPSMTVRTSAKIEVDQPRQRHQVEMPLDALAAASSVGGAEGVHHRVCFVEHRQQAVVGDDDQRVDLGRERLDPASA